MFSPLQSLVYASLAGGEGDRQENSGDWADLQGPSPGCREGQSEVDGAREHPRLPPALGDRFPQSTSARGVSCIIAEFHGASITTTPLPSHYVVPVC